MRVRQRVIAIDVDVCCKSSAIDSVLMLLRRKQGGYICLSNVHMCMEAFDDKGFQKVVNEADLVLADGKPISIAQRLLGNSSASQVRGQDLMEGICEVAQSNGIKLGLYGGVSDMVLDSVEDALISKYPSLNIAFKYSPPFRDLTEDESDIVEKRIKNSGVELLFVGIGCPKQERWMYSRRNDFDCIMFGVGAAFDFISGEKMHAPKIMQKLGLEWLFRLLCEPRRLWKRYLKQNPRFIYFLFEQYLKSRLGNR